MLPKNLGRLSFLMIVLILSGAGQCLADNALIQIERHSAADRNQLLDRGITLVAELDSIFLATGPQRTAEEITTDLDRRAKVIDRSTDGAHYALIGSAAEDRRADPSSCGEIITSDGDWTLVRSTPEKISACAQSTAWFVTPVDLTPLRPTRPEAPWITNLVAEGVRRTPDPLIEDMVSTMTDDLAMAHWQMVVNETTTRYSTSQGCADSAAMIYQYFSDLGLNPEYQFHTSGHAGNIVGTLPGSNPQSDEVVVIVGHLDDMPSSGNAPGADDNASGSAMVAALAKVMSCYSFENTIKFLVVTGEEFGLYGSTHYASEAASSGENIIAALNGDMIGWAGNGQPAIEDLDVNYHSSWPSLATLFVQSASDYNTGAVVNAFACDSMGSSDHKPFWNNGFPAICGITDNFGFCGQSGSNPYYHSSSDTIANCGTGAPAFYGGAVRTYLATAAQLAIPIAAEVDIPTSLTATPDGDNRISLSWSSSQSGVVFDIFRATGGCAQPGTWEEISEVAATSFVDTPVSGDVDFGYLIRARDTSRGCVSQFSDCAQARTSGSCSQAPEFGGLDTVVNSAETTCSLELNWSPADRLFCGNTVTYSVYRSTSSGFTPSQESLLKSGINDTTWTDIDGLGSQQAHYYIVRASDVSNGAEDTNTVEVKGVPTGPITIGNWYDDAGDTGSPLMEMASPWSIGASGGNAGPKVYRTGTYEDNTCAALTTPSIGIGAGAQLNFQSHFDIEDGWDKGEVQISTDGGSSWSRLEVNYPYNCIYTGDSCGLGTGFFFSSNQSSYTGFTADLSNWEGQKVKIRWVLSSDSAVTAPGWWIDEIEITKAEIPGDCAAGTADLVFADDFELGNLSAWNQ